MKRYGNLYQTICSMENLQAAYKNAKRGKGWYEEVREIEKDPQKYLNQLQQMLLTKTYKTSEYEIFYKNEGKRRKIYKLPFFPDRVAQWAIIQVIEPYLIKRLILDTYSAIPQRGIHFGLNRVRNAIAAGGCEYCLKFDIRHYYQSINHDILKQKYRRMFKDADLLWLLDEIIDSICTADAGDGWSDSEPTGVPIGNYLSQYSGNIFLSDFDHWMKEVKREKNYFRYMDDIVVLSDSKEHLQQLFCEIKEFMKKEKLQIKGNYQIFPTESRGIDFLGYRIFRDYTLLRKNTCQRMKNKMIAIRQKCACGMMDYHDFCSINSYNGWLIHCDSFRVYKKYMKPLEPHVQKYYTQVIKKGAGQNASVSGNTVNGKAA